MSVDGRSPLRPRQLNNLTLAPTAEDPRPTFFWSAESPRDEVITHSPYPKLLWSETGDEVTVSSVEAEAAAVARGYLTVAPASLKPFDALKAMLEAMSPEDRTLVLEAQQKDRLARVQAQLANLPAGELEALIAASKSKSKTKVA